MLPPHHLFQNTPRRLASAVIRLKSQIWTLLEPARIAWIDDSGKPQPVEYPYFWGRLFSAGHFRIQPPRTNPQDEELWLRWRDQAEGTLWIDGEPYFGFDVAHHECALPAKLTTLEVRSHALQSAIWHPDATGLDSLGSRLEGAEFLTRSDLHWKLYHDLLVLSELLDVVATRDGVPVEQWLRQDGLMPDLRSLQPLTRRLLRELEAVLTELDNQRFTNASNAVDELMQTLPAEAWALRATITGHAHIDLVWLWPERIGEAKAVHSLATADYLMERYGDFHFGYSQPVSYEAVARESPGLSKRVRSRIAEKRWEATGALYVESDTLLPCGEALWRSFRLGQKGFEDLTGKPSEVLWLPDVFGYSGCLPQLMRLHGVKYFFTNKLQWNDTVPFPYTSFRWVSPDGSAVLAYVSPETRNYYNGAMTAVELERCQRGHQQSAAHRELLIPTGFGDGGGGPTEEICERVKRLGNLAGLPRCEWGRIDGFYHRLEDRGEELPTHHGEILLQYHRGIYSSRSSFKTLYRRMECALRLREVIAAALGSGPVHERWWQRVAFAQFHDILPGSSIDLAYQELEQEFREMLEAVSTEIHEHSTGTASVGWFNPTPFDRTVRHNGTATQVPAYGSVSASAAATTPPSSPAVATTNSLSNETTQVEFNPHGEIISLTFGSQSIPLHEPLNQLALYANVPHAYAAWELDRHTLSQQPQHAGEAGVTLHQDDANDHRVAFTRKIGRSSRIVTTYRLLPDDLGLEITYGIAWHESSSLLKAIFPTGYRGVNTRFGQPFGSALRRQLSQSLTDEAHWEVPASRWALLSCDGETEGLTIATEFSWGFSNDQGTLGVSLLSSPHITGENDGYAKLFPPSLRDHQPDSVFADQGDHRLRIILAPWRAGSTSSAQHPAALADYGFTEPIPSTNPDLQLPLRGLEGLSSAHISWVEPTPNEGFVIRITETMGQSGRIQLRLARESRVQPIDGRGSALGPACSSSESIEVRPYQILSLHIT